MKTRTGGVAQRASLTNKNQRDSTQLSPFVRGGNILTVLTPNTDAEKASAVEYLWVKKALDCREALGL